MRKFIAILIIFFCTFNFSFSQTYYWSPIVINSTSGTGTYALTVYNSELAAIGTYCFPGLGCTFIGKWNGSVWSSLGTGINGISNSDVIGVFNNQIIAGGVFSKAGGDTSIKKIAKWDGTNWLPLGSGIKRGSVYALAVYNNELIVGGSFDTAAGIKVNKIAKWNGTSWSAMGSGMNLDVRALIVYQNTLIAGGLFTTADGNSALHVAKWSGTSWLPVGNGVTGGGQVYSFAIYNNELYAAGSFSASGEITSPNIGKWNGTNWSSVSSGTNSTIRELMIYNNELYAGGYFTMAGGILANRIAKWNGTNWSALGSGVDESVEALCVYNNKLIVGGFFDTAGGVSVNGIAQWGPNVDIKKISEIIPDKYSLFQNYPNPFNPNTNIRYSVKQNSYIRIVIYDILGKEISVPVFEKQSAGEYEFSFDGSKLNSGIYFYSLYVNGLQIDAKRMVLIK